VIKLKIVIISTYPPQKCGIAIIAENLANSFRELGHTVKIICFKGFKYTDEDAVPILKKNSLFSYLKAAKYILSNKFDKVIIEHEYLFYNLIFFPAFLFYLKLKQIKINLIMHTIASYDDIIKKNIFKIINTSVLLFTDNYYLHTKNAIDKIKRNSFNIPKNIILVPLAIEYMNMKQKSNPKNKKKNLLAFGFIVEGKGFELVVKAFGGIKNFNVKIVGAVNPLFMKKQYYYFNKIKMMAKEHKNIEIIEKFIPNNSPEKKKLLQWADFVLLPYIFIEQSAALTTAWGCYKIPICSDIPPFKEEIKKNKYGILFKSNDSTDLRNKVEKVSNNIKVQQEIIDNIKKLVDRRNYKAIAKEYIKTIA